MAFEKNIGTRAQVWHGTAKKTSGNLTKHSLMKNKHGRIVSRKMHNTAKKQNRLVKAGYTTKKGHFGFIKTAKNKKRKGKSRGKGHRGGMMALSPHSYDGKGVGTSGVDLQFIAGNAN